MKLHRRMWTAAKFAAGLYPMRRDFQVLPDDCLLVSYPRSGSTWLRFLISNVRFGADCPTTFENLNDRIPYALRPRASTMARLPRPRILKSHSAYDCRFRKVVLLVRDPRDVAISYYHYHVRNKRIEPDCPIESYVPRYVLGEMDNYGSWGENVGSWLGARQTTDDFLFVRYEDMKADTAAVLTEISSFLGLSNNVNTIRNAVDWSGPQHMKPRKATPGEWRNLLSAASVEMIESGWWQVLEKCGYELTRNTVNNSPSADFTLSTC